MRSRCLRPFLFIHSLWPDEVFDEFSKLSEHGQVRTGEFVEEPDHIVIDSVLQSSIHYRWMFGSFRLRATCILGVKKGIIGMEIFGISC
jgi:hypothetical protein